MKPVVRTHESYLASTTITDENELELGGFLLLLLGCGGGIHCEWMINQLTWRENAKRIGVITKARNASNRVGLGQKSMN